MHKALSLPKAQCFSLYMGAHMCTVCFCALIEIFVKIFVLCKISMFYTSKLIKSF